MFNFIYSSQYSSQIYIFYNIAKGTQVNRKLEECLFKIFIFFFVIGRTLSYFAKILKRTLSCWFTACSQMNRVTDKNGIPEYVTMQKNASPF